MASKKVWRYWTPPYCDVFLIEINNKIKSIIASLFFSFPHLLPDNIAQLVRASATNLAVMNSNPAGSFIIITFPKYF